jgi:hypothetical protein
MIGYETWFKFFKPFSIPAEAAPSQKGQGPLCDFIDYWKFQYYDQTFIFLFYLFSFNPYRVDLFMFLI